MLSIITTQNICDTKPCLCESTKSPHVKKVIFFFFSKVKYVLPHMNNKKNYCLAAQFFFYSSIKK